MSDTHAQPTLERAERPERGNAKPATEKWNSEALERAYKHCLAIGGTLNEREDALENSWRDFRHGVYTFLDEALPESVLKPARRKWSDATGEKENDAFKFSPDLVRFMRERGIKLPHMRAANPFIGVVQHFLLKDRHAKKQLSMADVKAIETSAEDVEKQRKRNRLI